MDIVLIVIQVTHILMAHVLLSPLRPPLMTQIANNIIDKEIYAKNATLDFIIMETNKNA